jgi:hypothetical protein
MAQKGAATRVIDVGGRTVTLRLLLGADNGADNRPPASLHPEAPCRERVTLRAQTRAPELRAVHRIDASLRAAELDGRGPGLGCSKMQQVLYLHGWRSGPRAMCA